MSSHETAQGKIPGELAVQVESDAAYFRELPLAERAKLLVAVCAATMDVLA